MFNFLVFEGNLARNAVLSSEDRWERFCERRLRMVPAALGSFSDWPRRKWQFRLHFARVGMFRFQGSLQVFEGSLARSCQNEAFMEISIKTFKVVKTTVFVRDLLRKLIKTWTCENEAFVWNKTNIPQKLEVQVLKTSLSYEILQVQVADFQTILTRKLRFHKFNFLREVSQETVVFTYNCKRQVLMEVSMKALCWQLRARLLEIWTFQLVQNEAWNVSSYAGPTFKENNGQDAEKWDELQWEKGRNKKRLEQFRSEDVRGDESAESSCEEVTGHERLLEKIREDMRWDEWHELRWDELTQGGLATGCDEKSFKEKLRWDEETRNNQTLEGMSQEWKWDVKRLMLQSTEGLPTFYRHFFCSIGYRPFIFETSAPSFP